MNVEEDQLSILVNFTSFLEWSQWIHLLGMGVGNKDMLAGLILW